MTLPSSDIERKGGVKRKLADTLALAPKEGFIQTPSPESEPLYAQVRTGLAAPCSGLHLKRHSCLHIGHAGCASPQQP